MTLIFGLISSTRLFNGKKNTLLALFLIVAALLNVIWIIVSSVDRFCPKSTGVHEWMLAEEKIEAGCIILDNLSTFDYIML